MLVIDYICEKLDRLKVSDVIRSINIVAFIIILFVAIFMINHISHTNTNKDLKKQGLHMENQIKTLKAQKAQTSFPATYVGQFRVTHYCHCVKCTGKKVKGRTATGYYPRKGRTIAVDKNKIPLHSIVYVEGVGYFVAEDVGGGVKGDHIDIYVESHEEALKLGTLKNAKKRVWIMG